MSSNVKRRVAGITILVAASSLLGTRAARAQDVLRPVQGRTEKLASDVGAAVVAVGQRRMTRPTTAAEVLDYQAGGAGFLIDEKGHVLTCASLIPETGPVEITLRGHHKAQATVVARDPRTRVALLRLSEPQKVAALLGGRLPFVPLGKSSDLRRGRLVATLGNPYDTMRTDGIPAVSLGVVSALGRLRDADSYKGYAIETDAAVNPGSFGGPLVDLQGKAVGVVIEAVSPKRWLGVAVPIDEVALALEDMKAGRATRAPWLGLSIENGTPTKTGLAVASVEKDGPAARAGLRAGDRLRSLDGSTVTEAFDVERELGWLSPGAPVELAVDREGRRVTLVATLGAGKADLVAQAPAKPAAPAGRRTPALATEVPPAPGKAYVGLTVDERADGVYVKSVVEGGPAAAGKIKEGDKLLTFNGKPVKTKQDVLDLLADCSAGQKVTVRIEREGWARNCEVVLGTKDAPRTEPKTDPRKPAPRDDDKPAPKKAPKGKVGFLGIAVAEPDENPGLKVSVVAEGSPAEKAKIQKDDYVLEIGGVKLKDIDTFMTAVRSHKPGEVVKVKLSRDGWERTIEVTLAERPAELDQPRDEDEHEGAHGSKKAWIGVAALEKDGRVVIDEIAPDSPASAAKLQKGDVVRAVVEGDSPTKIGSLDELEKFIVARKAGDKLTLVVERDGWSKNVVLTLAAKPADKDK